MNLNNLFILSPARRLETYYGFPLYSSCAKPLIGRKPMQPFDYQSDEERFTQCGNRSNGNGNCTRRCSRNYYSPFQ